MQRFVFVTACLLGGCYGSSNTKGSSVTGGLTTGAITTAPRNDFNATTLAARMTEPGGGDDQINGVEFRGYVASTLDEIAIPNLYGFTVRQLGDGVQSSVQAGY